MEEKYCLDLTYTHNVGERIKEKIRSILDNAERDGANVVIVSINDFYDTLVFAQQAWLDGFNVADNVEFCGYELKPSWGSTNDLIIKDNDYSTYYLACCGEQFKKGWRGRVTRYTVEEIEKQYHRAQEYQREIVLKVKYLD